MSQPLASSAIARISDPDEAQSLLSRVLSPLQFLAQTRLKSARVALLRASPTDTVASIALASGFSHLGHFAEVYRQPYGEKPSETMRRG